MKQFDVWFSQFLTEKEVNLGMAFDINDSDTVHYIPIEVVIEAVFNASPKEKAQIQKTLVQIDFNNGDHMDFFRHLAWSMVQQRKGV